MDPLADHDEMGRRLAAARGYMILTRAKFAPEIDMSVPTIRRYELGKGLENKSRLEREQIAEHYQRVTKCPASLLFGDDLPTSAIAEERISRIEQTVSQILDSQDHLLNRLEELDERDDSEQDGANSQSSEEHGTEGASE